jgi:hypothetical protein
MYNQDFSDEPERENLIQIVDRWIVIPAAA